MKDKETNNSASSGKKQFAYILSVGTALIIVFFILSWIADIFPAVNATLSPVLIGLFVAYLLNPVLVRLEIVLKHLFDKTSLDAFKKRRLSKALSITLTMLLAVAIITSLFLLIIPEFIESLSTLISELPGYLGDVQKRIDSLPDDSVLSQNLDQLLQQAMQALQNWITNDLPTMITTALNVAKDGVVFVFNFIIGLIISIYVMKEKDMFIATSKKLCYALFSEKRANDIVLTARHGNIIFGHFLSGKVIESSLVGVMYFIVMSIVGMKYSLLISVIMAVCNFIPMFGPYIGGIPSGLILLMVLPKAAFTFAFMVIVIQTLDANVFGPLIMGQKTGLSEFWITFAIFFFGGFFGLTGLFLGIPLLAVIFYVFRALINNRLAAKDLPTDNTTYFESDILKDGVFTVKTPPEHAKRKIKNPFKRNKNNDGEDDHYLDDDEIDIDSI